MGMKVEWGLFIERVSRGLFLEKVSRDNQGRANSLNQVMKHSDLHPSAPVHWVK